MSSLNKWDILCINCLNQSYPEKKTFDMVVVNQRKIELFQETHKDKYLEGTEI